MSTDNGDLSGAEVQKILKTHYSPRRVTASPVHTHFQQWAANHPAIRDSPRSPAHELPPGPLAVFPGQVEEEIGKSPYPVWWNFFNGPCAAGAAVMAYAVTSSGFVGLIVLGLMMAGIWMRKANHAEYMRSEGVRHAHHLVKAEAAQAERNYAYYSSLPANRIQSASDPLAMARQVMAEDGGTVFLGQVPDSKRFVYAPRNQHVLALGPGGWGKSTGIYDQTILNALGAVVSTSIKVDTFLATYKPRATLGRVFVMDPSNAMPDLPEGVIRLRSSLLWNSRNSDASKRSAKSTVASAPVGRKSGNDLHWTVTAEQLLAPLAFAAALHQDVNAPDLHGWVELGDFETPLAILETVIHTKDHPLAEDAEIAHRALKGTQIMDHRQRSGVISTLKTVLDAYGYTGTKVNVLKQNFDPAEFVKSTDTVYVIMPSDDQETMTLLVVSQLNKIITEALKYNAEHAFYGSTRPPLLLALDELANIAPLHNLPSILSQGGGQGVQVLAGVQTLAQVRKTWSDYHDGFFDLFHVICAFGGLAERTTRETLSVLCGDYDRQYSSQSWSSSTGTNRSKGSSGFGLIATPNETEGDSETVTTSTQTSVHKERHLTEADISTLPKGYVLVIEKGAPWRTLEVAKSWAEPWSTVIASAPEPGRCQVG